MPSNHNYYQHSSGMRENEICLISFDDDAKRDENHKPNTSDFDVASSTEKPTMVHPSDETADVSESDSDFDSEHSFSIAPYTNSDDDDDDFIPTKNNDEHGCSIFSVRAETVRFSVVTPYSSRVELNDEKDCSIGDVKMAYGAEKKVRSPTKTKKWLLFVTILLAALFGYRSTVLNRFDITTSRETIYCPGAGFSGFWYTLGRLQSIEQPDTKEYYCFSAGCLGVVSSMRNFTVDETLEIALNIQQKWKTGQIKRHDVVGEFVDALVNTTSSTMSNLVSVEESKVLERIHVITSTKNSWFGMATHIRTPQTAEELREMLLQTTWIPFAVGESLWHKDSTTGSSHMDGAFTMPFHPKTTHALGLPFSPEILLNVVNVNISLEKVKQFWRAGVARGV